MTTKIGHLFVLDRETGKSLLPSGLPCNPPWGVLIAVDLATGMKRWEVPIGSIQVAKDKAIPGSLTLGGPMVTGGGLVFIAATVTETKSRAYDVESGREVWSGDLPASAQSTPMTYSVKGKQYIVICAGGHGKVGS